MDTFSTKAGSVKIENHGENTCPQMQGGNVYHEFLRLIIGMRKTQQLYLRHGNTTSTIATLLVFIFVSFDIYISTLKSKDNLNTV